MNFTDIKQIRENGFSGFKTIKELYSDKSLIPQIKGVYLVLLNGHKPEFVEAGTGGYFKQKNPNVPISFLASNWVNDTSTVYIGQAGGNGSNATLNSRLWQYLRFGNGAPVGHYGGRLIWQIKNCHDLLICWKPLPAHDPRENETKLILLFKSIHSVRPFANLTD